MLKSGVACLWVDAQGHDKTPWRFIAASEAELHKRLLQCIHVDGDRVRVVVVLDMLADETPE